MDSFINNDDDMPVLSGYALEALQSFLSEQQKQQERFDAMKEAAEQRFNELTSDTSSDDTTASMSEWSMDLFQEDWQLSQFWYSEETARALAEEAMRQTQGLIVCISAPSVYVMLKKLKAPNPVLLLEFDKRFAVFKEEFLHYDYNQPLSLLEQEPSLRHAAQVLVVDPPFLEEDCLKKTCQTVRALAADEARLIISTGWIMRDMVRQELKAQVTHFRPTHHGGLANEFACYTNYQSEDPQFQWDMTTTD